MMGGKTRTVKNLDLCPLWFLSPFSSAAGRQFSNLGGKETISQTIFNQRFSLGGNVGPFFFWRVSSCRKSFALITSSRLFAKVHLFPRPPPLPLFPVFPPPAGYEKRKLREKVKNLGEKKGNRLQYFVSHLISHTRKQKCARNFWKKNLRRF